MRILSKRNYHVRRFSTGSAKERFPDCDYGNLPGSDVRGILRGCKYDPTYDMWFKKNNLVGFSVEVLN